MTLAGVPILEVWRALGGGSIRHGRAAAFYRGGDNPTAVSIDLERGRFYDHVTGIGGGCLALVETALSCSRADALGWLEQNGFIEPRRLSPADRRQFAQRRAMAEQNVQTAEAWRAQRLYELDRAKQRADAASDWAALEVAARAEFLLATADGAGMMDAYRHDRQHNAIGYAKTMRAAAMDDEVWQRLDDAVERGLGVTGMAVAA